VSAAIASLFWVMGRRFRRTIAVVQTINVGNNPLGVAVSPTGPEARDLYVTNGADDMGSVISFT
jgi:DNA-binding beta-propeller fold protein YncE